MNIKAEIKALIVIILLAMGVGIFIDAVSTRETVVSKPCSVVQTETVNGLCDIYEVTVVDTEGNLWAYYDDMPRDINDVMICEFRGDEIISARERR